MIICIITEEYEYNTLYYEHLMAFISGNCRHRLSNSNNFKHMLTCRKKQTSTKVIKPTNKKHDFVRKKKYLSEPLSRLPLAR